MAKRINQLEFQAELIALSGSADTKNPVRYFQLADVAMRYQPESLICECGESTTPPSFTCDAAPNNLNVLMDGAYSVSVDGTPIHINLDYKFFGVLLPNLTTELVYLADVERGLTFYNDTGVSHRIKLEVTDASPFTQEALEEAMGLEFPEIESSYSIVMTESTLEFCLGLPPIPE